MALIHNSCNVMIISFFLHEIQQQAVMAEIRTNLDSEVDSDVRDRDLASLDYLQALNQIFETGLLSKEQITGADSATLKNIQVGMDYFTTWCDEVIAHGNYCTWSTVFSNINPYFYRWGHP